MTNWSFILHGTGQPGKLTVLGVIDSFLWKILHMVQHDCNWDGFWEMNIIHICSLFKGRVTGKTWANKNLIWAEKLGPQAFVPASPTSAVCLKCT